MLAASVPQNLAILPGEHFKVLASSATLRKHLTDGYWCHNMELVCDGKLEGEVIRFTGKDLVMMRFHCSKATRTGHKYDFSFSLPAQYLVPVSMKRALGASLAASVTFGGVAQSLLMGASLPPGPTEPSSPLVGGADSQPYAIPGAGGMEPFIPHLCVVCGRWDLPGEVRKHGYKCNGCIGTRSLARLRTESFKLKSEVES